MPESLTQDGGLPNADDDALDDDGRGTAAFTADLALGALIVTSAQVRRSR
jgi:hypothetical protein